ncbi:MAG: NAD-glutamate dehydrogenase [Rhodomicrobium sp.]|nr:NAD-glutamate dehydrogenase [Rhodomicrobium sp.]
MNELNITEISKQVQTAVSGDSQESRMAADFTAALLAGIGDSKGAAAPPERLARLAINAFSFFKERPAKTRKLRAYDFDDGSGSGAVTVIEAVNDDMPFLLSSLLTEIMDLGLTARFVSHPIFRVQRDAEGRLTALASSANAAPGAGLAESFMHIEIDPVPGEEMRADLLRRLEAVLDQVRLVVADWMPMVSRLREVIDSYVTLPPPVAVDELAESVQFLKWLADGHFTFLGLREYEFSMQDGSPHLEIKPDSGLGLLRDVNLHVLRRTGSHSEMSPIAREFFSTPALLIIAKANFLSPVQRRVHVDSIGIKRFSPKAR